MEIKRKTFNVMYCKEIFNFSNILMFARRLPIFAILPLGTYSEIKTRTKEVTKKWTLESEISLITNENV